jgi:hypothetical protein
MGIPQPHNRVSVFSRSPQGKKKKYGNVEIAPNLRMIESMRNERFSVSPTTPVSGLRMFAV